VSEDKTLSLHGVILAAGASARMGSPKALLPYEGRSFLDRMLDSFTAACDTVAVVTAPDAEPIRKLCESRGIPIVINPAPERGMLTSLQSALAAHDAGGYLFSPVDYPALLPETVKAIVDAFRREPRPVIVPLYSNCHGHPVCISREVARDILALPPEASARDAIHVRASGTLYLPVNDPGILRDVDTPADYAALKNAEGA
jgi:molybdenum cofactor cytidylyltransferase